MTTPDTSRLLTTVVRNPLVHFLLLGAAIYGLHAWLGPDGEEGSSQSRIVVSAGDIESMRALWQKRWNRPPTAAEEAGLIRDRVRETVLYREALAMGLDEDDVIVRRRLAQKLEFLVQDLVESIEPGEDELRAHFESHRADYREPGRTTITQIFVDPDLHEDDTFAHAERVGRALRALDPPTEGAAALGDRFLLQDYYPDRTEQELAKLFGSEFARAVEGLETGSWRGPQLSGYGVHWVYVHARTPPRDLDFEVVRSEVARDWQDARREEANARYYEKLLARYEIVVEPPADGKYASKGPEE